LTLPKRTFSANKPKLWILRREKNCFDKQSQSKNKHFKENYN